MLNPFGSEYELDVIGIWLRNDPSLWLGVALSIVVWKTGRKWPAIWPWVAAYGWAFLPLSLYIWDIPFTHRIICRTLHDRRPLFGTLYLRSLYFYILGAGLFVIMGVRIRARARAEP